VSFQIKDQGIGISEEDQATLYDPFRRGGNVKGILGTGLGLALVKRCVDLHQGTIALESAVGVGSTFTVTLPQSQTD
jgi:signal transduction histidine kinase